MGLGPGPQHHDRFTPNNPKMTQSYSVSQLFIVKNVFLEKKAHFYGNKTVNQRSGVN